MRITVSTRPRWAQGMQIDDVLDKRVEARLRLIGERELHNSTAQVFVVRAVNDAGESITLVCDRAKLFHFEIRLREQVVAGAPVERGTAENAVDARQGDATVVDGEEPVSPGVIADPV